MSEDMEVTDPRGRRIRCPRQYWDNHVLAKHPDLKGCETYAERALRSPKHGCIYTSKTQVNRHIYYGELRSNIEIKVVVQFDSEDEGTVVSVTACSRRPNGENLIWHR